MDHARIEQNKNKFYLNKKDLDKLQDYIFGNL